MQSIVLWVSPESCSNLYCDIFFWVNNSLIREEIASFNFITTSSVFIKYILTCLIVINKPIKTIIFAFCVFICCLSSGICCELVSVIAERVCLHTWVERQPDGGRVQCHIVMAQVQSTKIPISPPRNKDREAGICSCSLRVKSACQIEWHAKTFGHR